MLLSGGTLEELSKETYLSAYQGLGEQLCSSLQRGLRYGRPIEGYAGMAEQIENAHSLAPELRGIFVLDRQYRTLCAVGERIRADDARALARKDATSESPWRTDSSSHALLLPLRGRGNVLEGHLLLMVGGDSIKKEYARYLRGSVALLAAVAAAMAAIQSGWVWLIVRSRRGSLHLLLLIFAGGAQAAYGIPAAMMFAAALTDAETEKVEIIGRTMAMDLERLDGKGVDFLRTTGMAGYLGDVFRATPEIAAIELRDDKGGVHSTGGRKEGGIEIVVPVNRYWPDRHTPSRRIATLRLWTDPGPVRAALGKMYVNMATFFAISLLLLVEISRMIAFGDIGAARGRTNGGSHGAVPYRSIGFIYFFGYDMVLSFVPLTAALLPGSLWVVPRSLLAASPITAEAIMGGAGILAAGTLSHRFSARFSLHAGLAATVTGAVLAGSAATISLFVLARAVSGLGFGLFFMSCQLALLEESEEAGEMARMYSGVLAGSLCGVASGAMVAELAGFRKVFFLVAVFSLLTMIPARRIASSAGPPATATEPAATRFAATARFFMSRDFLLPVLAVTLPTALTLSGFVYFVVPLELSRRGMPQGDIGRLFMLYGMCFIFAGPGLARVMDRFSIHRAGIAGAGVANAAAVILAWMHPVYAGYAMALMLAGIANASLASSAILSFLQSPKARQLGKHGIGSVYRLAERLGHMAGPLVFSVVIAAGNEDRRLGILGLAFLAGALAFLFIEQRDRKS